MDKPVEDAIAYVRRFADLAESLAQQNVVVRSLGCSWSAFGSFEVEASEGIGEAKRLLAFKRKAYDEPGPDVYQVSWDGKDHFLSLGSMRSTALTIVGPRRSLDSRSCDSWEDAISATYEWLTARIGSLRSH